MKDRIKQLLIGGLKASEVATVVGCTPAYVSQLLAQEDFKKDVDAGRILEASSKTEDEHLEQRYQNLEHKLITSISEDIPNADFSQRLRALDVVGRRYDERRKIRIPAPATPAPHTSNINNYAIVNLALPGHILEAAPPMVQMNENREIVSIDNQPLAPMSADGVKGLFARILERKRLNANQQRYVVEQLKVIDPKIVEEL